MVAWLSLAIGVMALLVSGMGQYYSFLLQQDDVRAIVQVHWNPEVKDSPLMENSGIRSVTFINSGNRSAVVTQLGYDLIKLGRDDTAKPEDCIRERYFNRTYWFDPAILKPGDIVMPRLQAGGTIGSNEPLESGDRFLMCITFVASTPDSETESMIVLKAPYTVSAANVGFSYTPDARAPDIIVKRSYIRILGLEF